MLPISQAALVAVLSATLAIPSIRPLVELARVAGARVTISQNNNLELRNLCYADAERELQGCQEALRENCTGVYEQDRRVCQIRYPLPVVVEEDDINIGMWVGVILTLVVAIVYLVEEQEDEIY